MQEHVIVECVGAWLISAAMNDAWVEKWHMQVKGRHVRGEAHPNAKLTTGTVVEIFHYLAKGWTNERVAQEVGVNPSTVSRVRNRRTWKDVKVPIAEGNGNATS